MRVVFQHYAAVPALTRSTTMTTEAQREVLKTELSKLSGVARRNFRLHGTWVPAGARLVQVESTTGATLAQNHSDAWMRRLLRARSRYPVTVVISTPANTQVAEQGWAILNKPRHTLNYVQPHTFEFLLLRILHELNKDLWGGLPIARAPPAP